MKNHAISHNIVFQVLNYRHARILLSGIHEDRYIEKHGSPHSRGAL